MSYPKGAARSVQLRATAFDNEWFGHLPFMDISSSGESPFVVTAHTCETRQRSTFHKWRHNLTVYYANLHGSYVCVCVYVCVCMMHMNTNPHTFHIMSGVI